MDGRLWISLTIEGNQVSKESVGGSLFAQESFTYDAIGEPQGRKARRLVLLKGLKRDFERVAFLEMGRLDRRCRRESGRQLEREREKTAERALGRVSTRVHTYIPAFGRRG